jgi:UDP-N-acetylmuramoylalanine--D-glutamate ligase
MSNFPATLFAGQRFAVVGLGRNGLPAAQALTSMGASVVAWDDNPKAREAAETDAGRLGYEVSDPNGEEFAFDALVLSPGIPHIRPRVHPIAARALAAGVPILTDAELLYRAVRAAGSEARFVGITGTNGKSTTTALLAHILETAGVPVSAGANLGPAALSLPLLADNGVYVLEMSSYMLERLATIRFHAAVMLNLSPDHIERHGDMDFYVRAKSAIFARQTTADLAVIGVDDNWGQQALRLSASPARVVRVSGGPNADVFFRDGVVCDAEGTILPMSEAPTLPGAHNAQNAAAATAMALFLGVARADIAAGLRSYPGLPHRQELITTIDGIAFVNDSKATNADSTAWALGCHDRIVWIAGGMAKEGGIEALAPYFPRLVRTFLIGQDAPILAATLAAHGIAHETVGTLEAAVPAALAAARATGTPVVLLSPACASFDQFSGFDARGDRFADLARSLAKAGGA